MRKTPCIVWFFLLGIVPFLTIFSVWAEPLQTRVMLGVEEETSLSSQIDGRIQTIEVKEGDAFNRGQTLVVMDCAIQRAHKKKAVAELKAATYALEAQQSLVRLRSGSVMQTNLAAANVAKAEADLEEINVILDMCTIKAPFNGLVVKRLAHTQQYLSKGQPILEILDDSTLHAHVIVPSQWLLWLKKGTPFSFHLDETGKNYAAKVVFMGVRIDPASQTVLLKGVIEANHDELKVGMGGTALFSEVPKPSHE